MTTPWTILPLFKYQLEYLACLSRCFRHSRAIDFHQIQPVSLLSTYSLSDFGVLSNVTGSLSRSNLTLVTDPNKTNWRFVMSIKSTFLPGSMYNNAFAINSFHHLGASLNSLVLHCFKISFIRDCTAAKFYDHLHIALLRHRNTPKMPGVLSPRSSFLHS